MKYNDVQAVVDLIPALHSLLKYYTAHLCEKRLLRCYFY